MLQTVVLAGGLGTRIRPVYENLPKSLIPICGRPFLAWQLELLQKNGVTEVILCVSHKSDLIEKYISEEKSFGMQILFSYDGVKQIGI
jgi:NDP-sugar pyrophosphorylase family protein